jgi:hypothetical protein
VAVAVVAAPLVAVLVELIIGEFLVEQVLLQV